MLGFVLGVRVRVGLGIRVRVRGLALGVSLDAHPASCLFMVPASLFILPSSALPSHLLSFCRCCQLL